MHIDEWSLHEPARRTARTAALDLLARVRTTRDRLDNATDDQALHDFRVAIRRLRSWLRAFGGMLDDTLSPKTPRRLKRIARATGASRDLEVHLAWVEERRRTLRGELRKGADWLIEHLNRRKAASDLELRKIVDAEFDRAARRVERSMSRYTLSVSEVEPRFAAVAARLIRRHATGLSKGLRSVTTMGDRAEAHAARIAAKRLRYLLDPLDRAFSDVGPIVDQLGELQDRLGELHDAQLFGSEIATVVASLLADRVGGAKGRKQVDGVVEHDDPVPGLLAFARRLRRAEEAAFAVARDTWLNDRSAPLLSRVAAIADALDTIGKQGREIKRRYLLRTMPVDMPAMSVAAVDLGYLPGHRIRERIRRETSADETAFYRTIKSGSGADRVEADEATDEATFDALWPLTSALRLKMRCCRVEVEDLVWNVFEISDRGIVLAVVEVEDVDTVPTLPEWLEPMLERDVTGDESFSWRRLARGPQRGTIEEFYPDTIDIGLLPG